MCSSSSIWVSRGAVPVDVHHEPFQRRRGGFKCCQLCQSDNWNQSTSFGFVWLLVWSAVISNFGILSLIVACVDVFFHLPPPPHPASSSSVVRVVCVLSYPPLLSCFYLPFLYVSPATFRDQKPGGIRPESLISLPFNRHQHLNNNRVDRILWERRTYFLVNAHGKLLFSFVFVFFLFESCRLCYVDVKGSILVQVNA